MRFRSSFRCFSNSGELGFTLFELIVVIAIVGVLSSALLDRMLYYQEQAEKSAMIQTAGILRSALHLKLAELISRGKITQISALADANPMDWLAEKPPNYQGEVDEFARQTMIPGSWYFDRKNHVLVYTVERDAHFIPGEAGKKTIRFKLKLLQGDEIPGTDANSAREINGLLLVPLDSYRWF